MNSIINIVCVLCFFHTCVAQSIHDFQLLKPQVYRSSDVKVINGDEWYGLYKYSEFSKLEKVKVYVNDYKYPFPGNSKAVQVSVNTKQKPLFLFKLPIGLTLKPPQILVWEESLQFWKTNKSILISQIQ